MNANFVFVLCSKVNNLKFEWKKKKYQKDDLQFAKWTNYFWFCLKLVTENKCSYKLTSFKEV